MMTLQDHVVRHQEHVSEKSYEEVVAALEAVVVYRPDRFYKDFQAAAESDNSRETLENGVNAASGPSGFMSALQVDFGEVLNWYGLSRKAKMYIYGNPVVATSMLIHDTRVGGHVPLQILIYEDADGRVRIGYDLPSSIMSRFGNAEIDAVAKQLDEKVTQLVLQVTGAEI